MHGYNEESGASTNKWRGEVSVQSGDLLRLEIDGTALLKRAGAGVAGGAPSGKKRDYTLQVHQNQVTMKSDNCGDDQSCSDKGLCFTKDSMDMYECQCCVGYIGPRCEERDACYPSPCRNNGICVDISQGHDGTTFQCLCPYGFTGKVCEDTSDPCQSGPCQNGGTCSTSNETAAQFKCSCPPGFKGPLCQHGSNHCASSPCVCNTNPCRNGGTCWSSIDSYYCACKPEYTGKTCTDKIASEETEGDKTAKLLHKKEWVYEMPSGVTHVEHLYVAAGTLACALLIVILTVATCHCRMHETYKRIIRATPLFGCRGNRKDADLKAKSGAVKSSDKEPLATRRVMAPVDYTDMYYAMDFSDSQSSPLIQ
ncbi:unnamed protein product [Bemisia tabaci]|uniref:EGF-like domain-containing protein n=1 Tax=Bemisia tabaci TaxID=7038 RepID=A0A9P0A1H6_BEMTA|nr:unnamed protein product [Bemisia tabaci]